MAMTTAGASASSSGGSSRCSPTAGPSRGVLGVGPRRHRAAPGRGRARAERAPAAHARRGDQPAHVDDRPGRRHRRPLDSWSAFTGQTDGGGPAATGGLEAVHPDDRERVVDDLEGGRRGASAVYDCEYRLRGGRRRVSLDRGARGAAAGRRRRPRYFGVGHDITKRKRAEEAARRRLELESIVATVSDPAGRRDARHGRARRGLRARRDRALPRRRPRESLRAGARRRSTWSRVRVWRRATGLLEDGDTSHDLRAARLGARARRRRAADRRPLGRRPAGGGGAGARGARRPWGWTPSSPCRCCRSRRWWGCCPRDRVRAAATRRGASAGAEDDGSLVRLIADQLASLSCGARTS